MKKTIVLLFVLMFAGLGLFARQPFVETDKFDRVFDAEVEAAENARVAQEKENFKFEVGKDTQKEFDLVGTYQKIAGLEEKLNMGSYDLIFSRANGKLKVEAKLHDGEETFPSHILMFDRKSLGWGQMNTGSNFETAQSFIIKMNLLTAKGELVSTYTLARTW
ncbi:MAG: hypothetical protein IKL48_04045 [Elusimicrobiaceae bacterium]|nr:hypothetical protein [Elusimicrobiaceae bacterium]